MNAQQPAPWPDIKPDTPNDNKSEMEIEFHKNLDDAHFLVGTRLDELDKKILKIRQILTSNTDKVKNQFSRHLNVAEKALDIAARMKQELEEIEQSLNGVE